MYKICISEDSAQRQRELEKKFLSVLISHPYDELSVSDLCRHLGISRKSFYRYFSGKEGALTALLDHTLMEFDYAGADEDNILPPEMLKYTFEFWENQNTLLDILARDGLSMQLYQRSLEVFSGKPTFFSRLIPHQPSLLHEQRLRFVICGMMTMIISWHHCGYQPPIGQMVQTTERLLTQPLIQR